MGSNSTTGWMDSPPHSGRVVVVGDCRRNIEVMAESLSHYDTAPATSAGDLNPVLAGAVAADLVVVDTDEVDEPVTALLERLVDEEFRVLLLSRESTPRVRENAAATGRVTFREKPIRATDLRMTVERVLREQRPPHRPN
jgi:DNA-binding NtrC family response regulator